MISKTALRGHWQAGVAATLEAFRTWPWYDTLRTLRERFREDRLGLSAGSLTFTTLIALVPLVTVMLALFTAFPMFGKFQDSLQKYFLQTLVPDAIAKPVLGALTQFAAKANRLGSASLAVLLFSALSLMLTIDRTLNGIWRVRKPRPIAQRVLVYWAAITLGPLMLGISLSLTSYALTESRGMVSAIPGGLKLVLDIIEFCLLALAIAALFRYVPNTAVRWRHAMFGGLFVAVGFEVAKRAMAWYVGSVATFSAIYGAFATAPIFLLWLYLGWVIVLMGAVIAAYAPSLQMRLVHAPRRPGRMFTLATRLLQTLHEARSGQGHGVSLAALGESLQTDPLQIEPVLDTLIALDVVARLDEENSPQGARYVLLCDPERTSASGVIDELLLGPADSVQAFREKAGLNQISVADLLKR
ncbi:MAG TPA: YihY family inner membrane protein [Ideonella sp.]|uniref:YihY family inner membrane protein n=1 Tax=Ideonella sp. TaxID=1929293 RepID=UPI002D11B6E8|nr:YihY family inner membrane protein [Ideonella sp.]HSI51469.1 YihY family inner membrane protein [Ideonella sp.]